MTKYSTSNPGALSADAAANGIDIAYEELSITNVICTRTLSLLREWERDLNALDAYLRGCATGSAATEFLYNMREGSGELAERIRNLQDSVALFVSRVTALRNKKSSCRFNKLL